MKRYQEFLTSNSFSWWFGVAITILSAERIKAGFLDPWIFLLSLGIILMLSSLFFRE